jgi:hypothetical protein
VALHDRLAGGLGGAHRIGDSVDTQDLAVTHRSAPP